jgi:hypothetical protein
MLYTGSCHCGRTAFEVEAELTRVMECNCSICTRKGSLLWFVPRDSLRLLTPDDNLRSYAFDERTIQHRFCPECGIHLFGEGTDPAGKRLAAINVRCLEGVDFAALSVDYFDGRAL